MLNNYIQEHGSNDLSYNYVFTKKRIINIINFIKTLEEINTLRNWLKCLLNTDAV